jgi:hypothetical protein
MAIKQHPFWERHLVSFSDDLFSPKEYGSFTTWRTDTRPWVVTLEMIADGVPGMAFFAMTGEYGIGDEGINYACKHRLGKWFQTYIYWQASNTGSPLCIYFQWQGSPPGFISPGRGPPPAGVPPGRQSASWFSFMKKWLATAKPGNRGESLRVLPEVSRERITSVVDQYFTNLWGVGTSQGRGAPSIEYRDRQNAKTSCVKTFVEKYDTVRTPSGEGQAVRKEMTVQVEQWWNSSDIGLWSR